MDLIAESGRKLKRMLSFERKRVYTFEEGDEKNYRLLGQKGASLCELTHLGLPVPAGFIITTENFLEYVNHGETIRPELVKAYKAAIHGIEREKGKLFGQPSPDRKKLPLLLAVRAGTAIIVPGLMDTILNVGMSDQVVEYLIDINPGLRRFALDLHRRYLYQYGILVLRNPAHRYEKVLTDARDMDNIHSDDKLSVDALTYIVSEYRSFTQVPEDPYDQLAAIIEAMYQHSYTPRVSQSLEELSTSDIQIPRALSITIQEMVYGNLNRDSGSGVAFSRRPDGRDSAPVGSFLSNAEGKEVLDGKRHGIAVEDLMLEMPSIYEELIGYLRILEKHDQAIKYVEFTVENGVLYILETSSVNTRPNLKDSRYVVYYDLLLRLQEQEEEDEAKYDFKSDSKHDHELVYREESDGTYDMESISRKNRSQSKDEPGLDEILEDEVNRLSTKAKKVHK